MIPGMTTSASALLAEERLQQMLSNNLANMNTPGFKASDGALLAFPQMLMERMNYGDTSGTPIGSMGTGVILQEGIPMFTQGTLQDAHNDMDVAIVDGTAAGSYAEVVAPTTGAGNAANTVANNTAGASVLGTVAAGANGRLEVNGQALAVVDANGNPLSGVYAAVNPKYQGTGLYAADGSPAVDSQNQPSYVFVNAKNQVVGVPGQPGWTGASLRVGNNDDMGNHSFFPVAYQSPYASGIALSRDGEFSLNAQHMVVDPSGNAVLPVDAAGKPIVNGRIQINAAYTGTGLFGTDGSALVDAHGQPSYRVVSTTGAPIAGARLGVVDVDVTKLSPLGQSEFSVGGSINPAQVMAQLKPGTGQLKPGQIEQSTVDPTSTMSQMIQVVNMYQANANALQTENTALGLAVSDVGKVNG